MAWTLIDDAAFALTGRFNIVSSEAPDGLYVVRNGVAVAVTAADLSATLKGIAIRIGDEDYINPQKIIDRLLEAALTRPADGASE